MYRINCEACTPYSDSIWLYNYTYVKLTMEYEKKIVPYVIKLSILCTFPFLIFVDTIFTVYKFKRPSLEFIMQNGRVEKSFVWMQLI